MEETRLGPVGGDGGKPFDGYTIPDDARLTAVHIYTDWVIDALRFDYTSPDGTPGGRPPIGSHHVFYLDDDEVVTGLSGRCGWYVDAIRVHTNKRTSPLFGGSGGERDFALHAPPGYEVAGLFGHSDWYVDGLGLILRPVALRVELAEGAALLAEADAERDAAAAEETLDDMIDAVAAEMAAEAAARRAAGVERRGDALAEMAGDAEAMLGETATPAGVAALEAAVFDELVAALEEEVEAEFRAEADEEAYDWAMLGLSAALTSGDEDETGAWEPVEEIGDPLDVLVVVRRAPVDGEAALDALEEATMAEAIAALKEGHADEGTVDVTVYTQVIVDDETGQDVAIVMAVAGEATGAPAAEVEEADLDTAPGEAAVMVTDAIDADEDLLALEEEAVEGALSALEEDLGRSLEDADVTIYTGMTTDAADGRTYAAVVAIARPTDDLGEPARRAAAGRQSSSLAAQSLGRRTCNWSRASAPRSPPCSSSTAFLTWANWPRRRQSGCAISSAARASAFAWPTPAPGRARRRWPPLAIGRR